MADRPIPFSAPMVRALLEGTKTQTRRALRPQPFDDGYSEGPISLDAVCRSPWIGESDTARFTATAVGGGAIREQWVDARFAIGDRLWVRESYYQQGYWEPVPGARTKGGRQKWAFMPTGPISFDAPAEFRKGRHSADPATVAWHKRLGRFMPRAASRLTLTVTDVRVERLQGISERDCISEGLEKGHHGGFFPAYRGAPELDWRLYPDAAYRALWNHINGSGAWEENPWVVAVSFDVEHRNIDAGGAA